MTLDALDAQLVIEGEGAPIEAMKGDRYLELGRNVILKKIWPHTQVKLQNLVRTQEFEITKYLRVVEIERVWPIGELTNRCGHAHRGSARQIGDVQLHDIRMNFIHAQICHDAWLASAKS